MKKREWTQEQDELIIKYYGKIRNARSKLLKLPQFENINERAISLRAGTLNVSRRRIKFSPEEIEIMKRNAGEKSVVSICRIIKKKVKISRDNKSVQDYIKTKLGQSSKPDLYTVADLSIGFRCGTDKVVKWVKEGKLKGKKDEEDKRSIWRFKPVNVTQFIINHPFELEGLAVDVPWVISLILEFSSRANRFYAEKGK